MSPLVPPRLRVSVVMLTRAIPRAGKSLFPVTIGQTAPMLYGHIPGQHRTASNLTIFRPVDGAGDAHRRLNVNLPPGTPPKLHAPSGARVRLRERSRVGRRRGVVRR